MINLLALDLSDLDYVSLIFLLYLVCLILVCTRLVLFCALVCCFDCCFGLLICLFVAYRFCLFRLCFGICWLLVVLLLLLDLKLCVRLIWTYDLFDCYGVGLPFSLEFYFCFWGLLVLLLLFTAVWDFVIAGWVCCGWVILPIGVALIVGFTCVFELILLDCYVEFAVLLGTFVGLRLLTFAFVCFWVIWKFLF